MSVQYNLPEEAHLKKLACRFAEGLQPGMVLTFSGDIGAGKTSFIRALLRALKIEGAIKSPTYSLVESYVCQNFVLYHFDLYRISDVEELHYIGFREHMNATSVCCIEWPELAEKNIVQVDLHFALSIKGAGRHLSVEARTARGEILLKSSAH